MNAVELANIGTELLKKRPGLQNLLAKFDTDCVRLVQMHGVLYGLYHALRKSERKHGILEHGLEG